MPEHIYKNFRLMHICGKILCFCLINYRKEDNTLYHTVRSIKCLKSFFLIPLVLYLFIDTLYYMATKMVFTKIEIIYLIEIPFMFISAVYIGKFITLEQGKLIAIIEALQAIDALLSTFYEYSKSLRLINYITFIFNLKYVVILIVVIVVVPFSQFHTPEFKMYTLQPAIGCVFGLYYITHLLCIKLLLMDRTYIFNKIIKKFSSQNVSSGNCCICLNQFGDTNNAFCKIHQIK